jgi:mono/diheme cytochrome c family protein
MARVMGGRIASAAVTMPARYLRLAAFAACLLAAEAAAADESATLSFRGAGGAETKLSKAELRARCGPATVTVLDPYYQAPRRFVACPLERVFELGLGAPPAAFAGEDFLLVALDGYARTAPGSQLAEGGAFLALDDADRVARGETGFDPIDRRQVDAGPFYLIWTGPGRNDAHRYPWPYELARIEVTRFEERFPHTVPTGAPEGSPAQRGFAIFRRECVSCHAINGEGGRVGPELNVPRSIVEYRDAATIKAYVRDPASFRYTSMPPHPHLDDADLDGLVAYFSHMSGRKRDPGPGARE